MRPSSSLRSTHRLASSSSWPDGPRGNVSSAHRPTAPPSSCHPPRSAWSRCCPCQGVPGRVTLPDSEIAAIADAEGRAVITKDEDFRISHLLNGRPDRLVHVTCGNISTRELLALVDHFHAELAGAIARYRYVELDRSGVIVHDPS
ncbi:DUF5615 family PIN-like protein [Salana multivorans]